jgi:hypothetical protein
MRDWVITTEERNEKAFQLTQRAIQMEKEANELKQQVAQRGRPAANSTGKTAKVTVKKTAMNLGSNNVKTFS